MNKLFFILFAMLCAGWCNAQTFTQDEGIAMAQKLHEVEILSELGRDTLIEQIKSNRLQRYSPISLKDGSFSEKTMVSASTILIFCAQAFLAEEDFRFGILEQQKLIDDYVRKKGIEQFTEKDYASIQAEWEKIAPQFEGAKIEMSIPVEDTLVAGYTRYPSLGRHYSSVQPRSVHTKRSVAGSTKTRTLNDLLKIGLINQRIHDDVWKQWDQLPVEHFVLMYAADRAMYYEEYEYSKAQEIELLGRLKEQHLVTEENYQRAVASYNEYELKEKFGLLQFCNNALVLETKNFPAKPEAFYPAVFTEIKKILPAFQYTNLTVTLVEDNRFSDDMTEQRVTLTFEADGKKYRNTFFHDYISKGKNEAPHREPNIVSNEFPLGINKWLADRNSDTRLYFASSRDESGVYGQKAFGLIVMNKEQFDTWGTSNSDYFLFDQSHDNRFNSVSVLAAIEKYEELGLFSHLTAKDKEEGKAKVAEAEINGYGDILMCFPKTIVYFDWETGNLESPYEELTLEFASASRGTFQPKAIIDNFKKDWNKPTTPYGFEWNGKKYRETLEMQNDWLDTRFFDLIEKALLEQKANGKFYYCLNGGQETGYIFLTESQFAYLAANQPGLFQEQD